ncbi:hypothetical protein [Bradyrhizobium embrapense]|uniref:hypothetical protein n=1 Tax=Bradyrhizobium embrapense TaxID=630921 RepID=UPI00067C4D2D|nr:hypothetical protein [Bradyrhizobium embrapense]
MTDTNLTLSGATEALRSKFGDPIPEVLKQSGQVKEAFGQVLGFIIMLFAIVLSARLFITGLIVLIFAAKKFL